MTIESEITRITNNIASAYTSCNNKGATMPVTQNTDNLPATIDSISTGVTPTGVIRVTVNGVYDVTNYSVADVNIPSGITDLTGIGYTVNSDNSVTFDANYVVKGDNTIALVTNSDSSKVLPLFEDNADTASLCAWTASGGDTSNIVKVNLTALEEVSGSSAFSETFRTNTTITSVDLSNLTTVSGQTGMASAFQGCTGLTSIDLSSLTTISGASGMQGAFVGCTSLTSIDLSNLTTISRTSGFASALRGTAINSITFPSLSVLTGSSALRYLFRQTSSMNNGTIYFPALTSTSFGSYTNQFTLMLDRVSGCTVHFPSNLQSVIGSWTDVTRGFAGTNTTVLFDLPATT